MDSESFPYLSKLLGGYFHQDAFDEGQTDEDIMHSFRASTWDYQRLGARADIRRLLHQHHDHLLDTIHSLFQPGVIVGETDEEARQWLRKIDALLDEPAPPQ